MLLKREFFLTNLKRSVPPPSPSVPQGRGGRHQKAAGWVRKQRDMGTVVSTGRNSGH